MIIVDNILVSDELIEKHFCCDLAQCKGVCCVDGDAGAPLRPDELGDLSEHYPVFSKYMTAEGIAAIESIGDPFVLNDWGEFETPMVPSDTACAFACREGEMTFCAIEKAFLNGEIPFRKPLSCHLYPVRASKVGKYTALNFHHWDICRCARAKGDQLGLPLYRFLEEPLVRAFGQEWYEKLVSSV